MSILSARTWRKWGRAELARGVGHGGELTISLGTDQGERSQLPSRYGIRGVNPVCTDLEEVGSCGAGQVLGAAVFSRGTSARVPE